MAAADLDPELRKHLDAGNFDAVEDAFLAHLEEGADDTAYFADASRAVAKAGEPERARTLLEMVDGELREAGRRRARLDLLRRVGDLLHTKPQAIHREIVALLESLYGAQPTYEPLADKVGIHRAPDDIPKIWQKVERLESLLALDVGSIVRMEGKGAGRIVDVNMALESFMVKFESGLELKVRFHGAPKLLEPLRSEHLLRRKLEDPESLVRLGAEDPPALLRLTLESFGEPMTTADIKRALAGIVPDSKWTSWWAAARKHPQLVTSGKGRPTYQWAASSADAHGTLWEEFRRADVPTRLDLLRRHAERDLELRERMVVELVATAGRVYRQDPGLAAEIWLNLERLGERPDAAAPWSPRSLLAGDGALDALAGIRERALRERAYGILRDQRDDWPALFVALLRQESDPRSLDLLADALRQTDEAALGGVVDDLLSQPHRAPATFAWIAERAADDAAIAGRNPLRLLRHILRGLTDERFAPYRARLSELAESGKTMPRLLPLLDEAQAAQAKEAIARSPGLATYERVPLVAALELKFPSLREEQEAPLYATAESIAAKRQELTRLTEEEIPANRRAIEEAREMGDLRENFEYKAARQRHEYLASRATALNHDLLRARPIDATQVDGREVIVGSRVRLRGANGERALTILGPWESKPEEDVLSHESEIATGLLGKKPGEDVVLGDGATYTIAAIEPYTG